MEHQAAIALIGRAGITRSAPQHWADLGCGSGTFTRALANLLSARSTINAVDRNRQTLPQQIDGTQIFFSQADFESGTLPFHDLDGILLANALHYCRDAAAVLARLTTLLRTDNPQFLVVEYDSTAANRWVPYPLAFAKLKTIFAKLNFDRVEKLGEYPSAFRRENMYACEASRKSTRHTFPG